MQIAMIGLGRMGANMVRRLMDGGHDCVVHDVAEEPIAELEADGATGARTLEELVAALERRGTSGSWCPPRSSATTVDRLAPLLGARRHDHRRRQLVVPRRRRPRRARCAPAFGIHYLDVGTSGGVHGLERGYCLMVGGDAEAVDRMAPIFDTLAPGVDAAERTPGRTGDPRRPSRDGCTAGRPAPGTSSRWCTTASSTD